jgi:hypothetical protein
VFLAVFANVCVCKVVVGTCCEAVCVNVSIIECLFVSFCTVALNESRAAEKAAHARAELRHHTDMGILWLFL